MPSPLDQLKQNERAELPVGGDFAPSGFISDWFGQKYFTFLSETDLRHEEHAELPKYDGRRAMGSWFKYYYKVKAAAIAVMEATGADMMPGGKRAQPQYEFNLSTPRDNVLNFADRDKLAKWSDPIAFDVRITSLKSDAYRHELHMISLPLMVVAFANALGYANAGFPIADLLGDKVVYTDDFQLKMIGDKDNKGSWEQSELWQRRAALWASLGENDPKAYQPLGSADFATSSEKLSNCLRFLTDAWSSPFYLRVIQVPDPSMKGAYESKTEVGKMVHPGIPAILEFFGSKEDAQKAAQIDIERSKKKDDSVPASNGSTPLAIPTSWHEAGADDDWVAKINELKQQPLPNAPALNKLAKSLEVTSDELKAWLQA